MLAVTQLFLLYCDRCISAEIYEKESNYESNGINEKKMAVETPTEIDVCEELTSSTERENEACFEG